MQDNKIEISSLSGSFHSSAARIIRLQTTNAETEQKSKRTGAKKNENDVFIEPGTRFMKARPTRGKDNVYRVKKPGYKVELREGNFLEVFFLESRTAMHRETHGSSRSRAKTSKRDTDDQINLRCKFNEQSFMLFLEDQDRIFAAGARPGSLKLNHRSFRLLNIDTFFYELKDDSYSAFPWFLVQRGNCWFGILFNSSYPLQFDAQSESVHMSFIDNDSGNRPIDVLVFQGELPAIIESYTQITGRPFLPPVWSLGYHQSRWSYKNSQRVRQIAQEFTDNNLPLDAIHLDIHYMQDYKVFTFNETYFSDAKEMHKDLEKFQVRTVAIIDPGVHVDENYQIYTDGLEKNIFCKTSSSEVYQGRVWPGVTAFPDFEQQMVRDWWGKNHKPLFDAGVSGIWNDMNDPVLKMGKKENPFDEDITHKNGSHEKFRNLYANHEAMGTMKGFNLYQKKTRPFILTRSATCGIQKLAAVWTGDNHASWQQMQENLTMVLNLGLSGVPFSGADVGGFASRRGMFGMIKIFRNKELFARWMQLGSLMPFYRAHSVAYSISREPYRHGKIVTDISRKYIRLRYQLIHYIYKLFHQAHSSGAPVVRPMFWEFPETPEEYNDTQFMVGDKILAAPVLKKREKTKQVWLPEGKWVDIYNGDTYDGGMSHVVKSEIDTMPVFIRSGSLIALSAVSEDSTINIENTRSRSLVLVPVFEKNTPLKTGETVYLDDGVTLNDRGTSPCLEVDFEYTIRKTGNRLKMRTKLSGSNQTALDHISVQLPSNYKTMRSGGKKYSAETPGHNPKLQIFHPFSETKEVSVFNIDLKRNYRGTSYEFFEE